jgi:RND family efflux transporter MFP subunit
MKKIFTGRLVYFLLILLFIFLNACSGNSSQVEATPTPIPTPIIPTKPTYQVQRGDIEQVLNFTGRIVPITEEELFFGVGGRVDEVFVQQGEQVEAGQLLAVLETGNREFDLKRAQIGLEIAQMRLEMAKINTPKFSKTYSYTIGMQEKDVELAQLGLDELEKAVADARIVAPINGTIRSLNIRDGDVAEAFEPVLVVANVEELEVNADVGGDTLTKLQEGMPVTLTPVVLEGEVLEGTIRQLPYPYGSGSKGSADQTVRIETVKRLADAGYELGDLVEVLALLEKRVDILWLPPQAVRTFEGRKFVVVKDDQGQQRRVDVRLGLQSEDRVEILEGVEEGQVILAP